MAMSKDLVEFTLRSYYFDAGLGPNRQEDRGNVLMNEAFGLLTDDIERIRTHAFRFGHVRLIVRQSQFTRFMIIGEQLGFPSQFKALNAKLITPKASSISNEPIDLSTKAATHVR